MTVKGPTSNSSAVEKVHALLNPRNVVIVGATDRPGNWAMRAWRNLKREGFKGGIYPYNPARDTVWETRCYKSFAALPEPPDHLVVVVPAKHVPATLRDAAAHGARSATIFSSGFAESPEPEGQRLEAELKSAIIETGMAVSGPNCMGNISGDADYVSMIEDRRMPPNQGPVAIAGQSGGVVMSIRRTLEERGVDTRIMITSGNETGLNAADYVNAFVEHPGIRVIVIYVESLRDPPGFLAALAKARAAGKPVVVMKLGASESGRQAAMAHTGALAGSAAAFDAVAGAAGAIRARSLDEVVEIVELLVHAPFPKGARLGAVTLSGGMRGLLLDLAAEHGLSFAALAQATQDKLAKIMTVGSSVGNPLDAGYAALTNPNALVHSVEALLADPGIDTVLVQDELPRSFESEFRERNMRAVEALAAQSGKPVAYLSLVSHSLTDYSRKLRRELPHLAFMQDPDKTLRILSVLGRYAANRSHPVAAPARPSPDAAQQRALQELSATSGPLTADEVRSKAVLRTYGIATPHELVAHDAESAVTAAERIGFPVVAKAVSSALPHKSDAGAVVVGIPDADAMRNAYARIVANVARAPGKPRLDGILIAEMVRDGLELVIGAQLDPEVGPVILFGRGGVEIELNPDTALAAAPLDEAAALDLISRTRVSRLIDGYRGSTPLDRDALVQALIGVSKLMADARGRIQSIDVNPFRLGPKGGLALDALVVLAEPITQTDRE